MTENTRTATYISLALVLLVVAAVVNRKPTGPTEDTIVGDILFRDIKAPEEVAGLQIETLDAGDNRLKVFKVARSEDGWTLPSHGGYPADAEQQLSSAASSLIDLRVLSVVSRSPSEHATYGVLTPDPEKAPPGAEGVGKLVTVLDKSGKTLARLVIGHEDRGTDESGMSGSDELRFVRALPHDLVYRVALPAAKFTTNFADWIETDLLKLDAWDVAAVTLKDYAIDVVSDPSTGQIGIDPEQKSTIKLKFDDTKSAWTLDEMLAFEENKPKPIELAADEELNTIKLNELKTALDDLKIVDVHRKPEKMIGNLKADKSIFGDRQSMQSLIDRGFYPVPGESGQPEILSGNGEVLVRMKDGVEYLLRFGEVAGIGDTEQDAAKTDDKAKGSEKDGGKDENESGTSLNRFIMVSASFNKDLVPKPELEPLPEGAEEKATETTEKQTEDAPKTQDSKTQEEAAAQEAAAQEAAAQEAAAPAADAASADDSTKKSEKSDPASAEPADSKVEDAKETDDKSVARPRKDHLHFVNFQEDAGSAKDSTTDTEKATTKKPEDAGQSSDAAPSADSQKTESAISVDDAQKADADKNDSEKASESGKTAEEAGKSNETVGQDEERALKIKQIKTENERKQKEYDEKIKKGEERARELNARFADWYYVVSEATYRKIHLNRNDVVKKKADAAKTEAADADSTEGADPAGDPLKIPALKTDPFQKRDETKTGEEKDEEAPTEGDESKTTDE